MVTTKHCCYGVCRSDSRYADTDRMKKVFFIRFPKPHLDRAKAERWVNACRRDGFTVASVKKDTYICSLHFIGEDGPTTKAPDPVIATATPSQVSVVTAVYVSKARAGLGRCRPRIGLGGLCQL